MNRAHHIKSQHESADAPVRAGLLRRSGEGNVDRVPPIVHDVLHSSGRPLEATTRSFMEPRFGHDFSSASGALQASSGELQVGPANDPHEREADAVADRVMSEPTSEGLNRGFDFSQVRIHTDARAAESAHAVNAAAYTVGRDIVFGEGQYQPHTAHGQRLLAHELTHVAQQNNGPAATAQRQPILQRTRVTIATEGTCANERDLAQAIPGARAMAETAANWFISMGDRDRARVNLLLRANFLSDSDDVRDTVFSRILTMSRQLAAAQDGRVTFVCAPSNDPECPDREGYVLDNERNRIHICPTFFNLTPAGRQWMLVHECAHLAGAMRLPESYYANFGAMGEAECRQGSVSSNSREALGNADNYARLVWCLTRPPGIVITTPTATP